MCSTLINKHVMSFHVTSTILDKSTLTQRLVSFRFAQHPSLYLTPPGQPYTQRSHKHLQLSPPTPLSPSSPPLPPSDCPDPSPPRRRRRRRADACPFPPCNPRSPVGWLRVSFSRRRGSLRGNRCGISDLSGGGEKKGGEGC